MKQIKPPKDWLTAKGIAAYRFVSRLTAQRWIKDGKVSATKLPSQHYRISIADFGGFLAVRYANQGRTLWIQI
jgi:excisionase family DNA binding protein